MTFAMSRRTPPPLIWHFFAFMFAALFSFWLWILGARQHFKLVSTKDKVKFKVTSTAWYKHYKPQTKRKMRFGSPILKNKKGRYIPMQSLRLKDLAKLCLY